MEITRNRAKQAVIESLVTSTGCDQPIEMLIIFTDLCSVRLTKLRRLYQFQAWGFMTRLPCHQAVFKKGTSSEKLLALVQITERTQAIFRNIY